MTNEFLIILIASIVVAILLTLVITRLVILKNHEPKANFIALQDDLNKVNNEYAATQSRASLLQENHEVAQTLANERLNENQQLNNHFATATQQV